ncbi:MRG/MORF4L-binding protein-like [Coccinella septempunctata]|uniref:MRG/MORF4L-binding protein-like n=1 Tax=Coccinella septempunctata TaxID=41139 RepID=UPI001D067E30|nr:MRG/MORF4L-binding protein-like [Coccinella septempunctata]
MDDIEWTIANEGQLLDAMVGHKPVGVNKYFQMAFICEKFNNNINKDVDPDKIWAHLGTMYNLEALDENESIPFPNSEKEFALPDDDFASLISKKEEERKSLQKGRDTPKLIKETKKELKEEKMPARNLKDTPRRDSSSSNKETRDRESPRSSVSAKKEVKKETEKSKSSTKNRSSNSVSRDDHKKNKIDETPKTSKRPLRGSLKAEDGSSNGKSSPVPTTPGSVKRRRIL